MIIGFCHPSSFLSPLLMTLPLGKITFFAASVSKMPILNGNMKKNKNKCVGKDGSRAANLEGGAGQRPA